MIIENHVDICNWSDDSRLTVERTAKFNLLHVSAGSWGRTFYFALDGKFCGSGPLKTRKLPTRLKEKINGV